MNGLISARQLMLMLAAMRAAVITVFLPVVAQGDARQDAWIAALVTTLIGSLIGAMMASLAMRFPGKSLGSFGKETLGRPLGIVASVLVGMTLYVIAVSRLRLFSLVLVEEFFPQTPGWAIAVPIWLVVVYGSMLGVDSMGRAAEAVFTLIIGSIITGVLLLYVSQAAVLTNLAPVLERGWAPVMEAAVSPIFSFSTTAALVLAFGKYVAEPARLRGAVVGAILIAGALLTGLSALTVGVLGPHHAGHEMTPLLAVARAVFVGGVVERADLLLLAIWFVAVIFKITVLLLATSIILGDALGISFRCIAAVLFLVGIPAISFRLTDIFMLSKAYSPSVTSVVTAAIYVGVVGLVYGVALIRGKGGSGH
ncbi:MAG: GerAB/ArcD/ProY family transporter [Bacillota bacterium]|nr:GerAB/ArcD/ProY family transporter [Bacillota bacterium]